MTIEKGEPKVDTRNVCYEKGEDCAVRKFKDLQDAYVDDNHIGIEYCLDNGIMNGTGDTTFSPDATVTREQIAAIFYRYAEGLGLDMTVSEGWDLSTVSLSPYDTPISDYAVKPMSWCFDWGILQQRYDENHGWEVLYAPKHTPSRAETAMMFRNFAYALEMNK